MKQITFSPGDVIFHEGETSQEAYRILGGRVEITISGKARPIILAQLGSGDIFGEMALVDERPRSATARCVEAAQCEVMSPEDFQTAVLKHPHRLLPYLATFFERLRTVNDRLHLEMKLRAESRAAALRSPQPPLVPRISVPESQQQGGHHLERTRFHNSMEATFNEPSSGLQAAALYPMTPLCASKISEGQDGLQIDKYPFRIGRRSHEDEGRNTVFSSNDYVISDVEPFQISRSHCSIEREGDHFFVRDRGSTLGTIVNGTPIGVHFATLTCDLHAGENTITIGSMRSPFKFRIELT